MLFENPTSSVTCCKRVAVMSNDTQTPIPMKVGHCVKCKWTEYHDVQIFFYFNLIELHYKDKIFSFHTDKLFFFLQIFTYFEFDACNIFQKKLGQRQQKTEDGSLGMLKNTCLENCTGEQVNCKPMRVMISYKRSIPERLRCLQARLGWGSPLCEQLCEQIV